MDRKKIAWSVISVALAALSVWAVSAQCRAFSLDLFISHITSASPLWIAFAVLAMLGFIFFEAKALLCITRSFGYRRSLADGFAWSASDIYFSAITPSATGGQPACAYFMVRDGVPGVTSAVALLANLAMYTLSIIVIGAVSLLAFPSVFASFSHLSRVLIVIGFAVQVALLSFFVLLLNHETLCRRIVCGAISLGAKLKIVRRREKLMSKAEKWMDDYHEHSAMLRGRTGMMIRVLLWNIAQRASQIAVTSLVYLAMFGADGGDMLTSALRIFAMQSLVVIGANMIPIPGAMGVTDFLMLDVYGSFLPEESATSLELISRSLSFYVCIVICIAALAAKILIMKRRQKQ